VDFILLLLSLHLYIFNGV